VRVVSLVPSITETLLAWEVPVVGCTRFCEQPGLPPVGGTKDPDLAAIIDLAPDLVVVDREENRRDDADALMNVGLAVHVTHVTHLGQVEVTLRALARAVGVDPARIAVAVPETEPETEPVWTTAVVPIWRRPWMVLGPDTYGASVLAALGVRTLPVDTAQRYPTVDLAAVGEPALVVLPSEPYPFAARHLAEVGRLLPGSRGVLVDGRDLLWWGVRTPAELARLRAVLREVPTPR
jgi:ABC-type Fe3+-hydroxamate transport system substrate-binding protein